VITKNGGLIFTKPIPSTSDDSSRAFTVVPYATPREEIPPGYEETEIVTEMWIEQCMASNKERDTNEMVMFKPMPGPFPRSGATP